VADLPVLHQFPFSHFNEKARWGLDWKGVAHRRQCHLPGPHAFAIRRLSGQTATPVLRLDGEVIAGSACILEALEERFPERPLLPEDPTLRRRALEIQSSFDAEVGPAVRTAIFSVLIDEPDYVCRMFAGPHPLPVRAFYRASFPLARGRIARGNGVTSREAVERAFERARQALDRVAKEVGPEGQLAGASFSVADLACAALLAPLVDVEHPDMALPRPLPERFEAVRARWADHPAAAWVREQYACHRPSAPATAPR
jgi:glutathione S-transferase